MNSLTKSYLIYTFCCVMLLGSIGCGAKDWKASEMFSLDSTWPFGGDDDEPEKGVPVRVVGAWTDTVMTKPGQKVQRGFGGRLMFYGSKGEKPILVDGQLVVYAFNEAGREPTDTKPTRRYVFPPDQMPLHMSKSDIGASYSFWLPWDEAGGPKTEISLICRFEPKGGPVITGEQTRHMLPGPEVPIAIAAATPKLPEGEPFRPARPTLESIQAQKNSQAEGLLTSYQATTAAQAMAAGALANTAPGVANVPGVPGVTSVPNAAMIPNAAGVMGPAGVPDATGIGRQMTVTSISLPNDFKMPDASAFPRQSNASPAQPAIQPQPLQPALYQQPADGVQPMRQPVQPALMNQSAVYQQTPNNGIQQVSMPVASRPTLPTVSTPVLYSPPHQGFNLPPVGSQYTSPQPVPVQGAQPMPPAATVAGGQATYGTLQSGMQTAPSSQTSMLDMQPHQATMQQATPVLQTLPQQGWQQLPATNNVRTASSPTTATIPWR